MSYVTYAGKETWSNSFTMTTAFLFPCIKHLISFHQAWAVAFMGSGPHCLPVFLLFYPAGTEI